MHGHHPFWSDRALRAGFFLAILAAGVGIVATAVNDFAQARASLDWPKANGVVIERGVGGRIVYAYSWEAKLHVASRRRFLTGVAPGRARREPEFDGAHFVAVFVRPDVPRTAVLAPGGSQVAFAGLLILGGAFVFLGAGASALSLRPFVLRLAASPALANISFPQLREARIQG